MGVAFICTGFMSPLLATLVCGWRTRASFGTSVSYPEGVLTGVEYYEEYGVYYEMKQINL